MIHSDKHEKGLLGALMMNSQTALPVCKSHGIKSESFFNGSHAAIWQKMMMLDSQGKTIDLASVMAVCENKVLVEEICDAAPLSYLIDEYAFALKDFERRRTIFCLNL